MDHHVDRKVFADIAQHLEVAEAREPRGVVQDQRGVRTVEVQQPLVNHELASYVRFDLLHRQQLPLGVLPGRVADHPGAAARDHDRPMTCLLKAAQQQKWHQIADGQ